MLNTYIKMLRYKHSNSSKCFHGNLSDAKLIKVFLKFIDFWEWNLRNFQLKYTNAQSFLLNRQKCLLYLLNKMKGSLYFYITISNVIKVYTVIRLHRIVVAKFNQVLATQLWQQKMFFVSRHMLFFKSQQLEVLFWVYNKFVISIIVSF